MTNVTRVAAVDNVTGGTGWFRGAGPGPLDIFRVAAPAMAAKGWSVWPQERSGARMPGRVLFEKYGDPKPFKWGVLKERLPTAEEMAAFVRHCEQLNVACAFGPAQRHTFAVDVDCLDSDVSTRVQALAVEHLEQTPFRRVGRAPKIALIYRAASADEVPASISRRFAGRDDCALEVLSAGKPLTLYGLHHATGQGFGWLDRHPISSGPDAATAVTKAQVGAFLAAVEAEFPFAAAPAGGAVDGGKPTDWTARTDGLWIPRASGPDSDGKLGDGRDFYMNRLVYVTTGANGARFLAADAVGQGDEVLNAVKAIVLEAFEQSAVCDKRWVGQRLRSEVESRVNRMAAKLRAGTEKPWTPREKCRVPAGQVSENSSEGGAAAMDAATENKVDAVGTPKHEPEVVVAALRDAAAKPHIMLLAGEAYNGVVDAAERALVRAGDLWQRGDALVEVVSRPSQNPRSLNKKRGERVIAGVEEYGLLRRLSKVVTFYKRDGRKGEDVVTDPPMSLALTLLRANQRALPPLNGVITAPTLRADGTVLDRPGYDADTGLLYEPTEPTADDIAAAGGVPPTTSYEAPTRDEALQDLDYLKKLIAGFPFVTEVDRSVALSAFLTACVRRSLPAAPMHVFSAPTPASGKSKLGDIASIFATGDAAAVVDQGESAEELKKTMAAQLMEGAPVISIDNVDAPIGGPFMCQMLTQQVVTCRILGQSKTLKLRTDVLMTATGNNVVVLADCTRRVLVCKLDAKVERPELRNFEFEPVSKAFKLRNTYVSCCITILRAYIAAGRPR